MKTIRQQIIEFATHNGKLNELEYDQYMSIAMQQREKDIENCMKWFENFNAEARKDGINEFDLPSTRQWIMNMIYSEI